MQRIHSTRTRRTEFHSVLLWGGIVFSVSIGLGGLSASNIQAQGSGKEPEIIRGGTPTRVAPAFLKTDISRPADRQASQVPTSPAPSSTAIVSDPSTAQRQLLATLATRISPRQMQMLKQPKAEMLQVYRDAQDTAAESTRACQQAFSRGLMPVSDFADQIAASLEIRLAVADLQGDRAAKVAALSEYFELWKAAAKQLQDFNQPASEGWVADTEYATLLASNMELRLASARGDRATYQQAAERSTKLAESQFRARLADFQTGHASLSLLARSAGFLMTTAGLPAGNRDKVAVESNYADYIRTLEGVVEQTQKLAESNAGVGREDRLFQAHFELAKVAGQAALQQQNSDLATSKFDRATDAAKDWYDSELKFYQTGTASLRDITQAWWGRAELMDVSARSGLVADGQTLDLQEADFLKLQSLATKTEDRQGRIEADIVYVNTLQKLDRLWERQRAVQVWIALQKETSAKTPQQAAPRKPVEIKPDPGAEATTSAIPGASAGTRQSPKNSRIEIVTPQRNPR